MATLFPYLHELVSDSLAGLPGLQQRRMFGCDTLFVGDEIFVLLWKTGRIGVKLTDAADFRALMELPGAEQWYAGPKAMSHWVLLPEELHDDPAAVQPWVRRAYDLARARAAVTASKPARKTTGSAMT